MTATTAQKLNEFEKERQRVLQDLFRYFFENADFPLAEDFRLKHEDALRLDIFDRLQREELIRYLHDGRYAFHLGLYIETEYWKQDRSTIDLMLPTLQNLYRDPAKRGKPQDVNLFMEAVQGLTILARDRALVLLNELGLIAGQPVTGKFIRYSAIHIREEILKYKTIQEKIDHGQKHGYYNIALPKKQTSPQELSFMDKTGIDILQSHHDLSDLHPEITKKCSQLFDAKSHAESVEKGFKVVRDRLRELTGHETGAEAFGKGKLHIKGAAAAHVDKDFNEAVKFLTMAIDRFRNEKSHTADSKIDNPNRAHEYLKLSSLAMHLLDNTEILP